MRVPRVLRTLEPPRWRDAYSFSGVGRKLYTYTVEDPRNGQPDLDGPPREIVPPHVRG